MALPVSIAVPVGLAGMDASVIAAIAAVLTLVVSIVIHVFGGGWNLKASLSQMEASLRKAISDSKDEIDKRQEGMRREFGESLAAIRQKIHEIELWAANTFIRRESFYQVKSEITAEIKDLGDKIEARMERMENKIDGNKT